MRQLKPGSQNQKVWAYLSRGWKLTHRRAQRRLGVDRLAARAHELNALGYRVKSVMVNVGEGKRIAEYFAPRARS
jgi:hypothetical protein